MKMRTKVGTKKINLDSLTIPIACAYSPLVLKHNFFFPITVSLWNDLADPVFDGVGLVAFKSRANAFLLA